MLPSLPLKYWLACIACAMGIALPAQEICDNGIDDDGDGLIDLLDTECSCNGELSGFSADFEERTCCPEGVTTPGNDFGYECVADGWVEIGQGTADYFNTCGFVGSGVNFVPMPIPSGDGALGFISRGGNTRLIEGVANCLDCQIVAGNTYSVDFFLGFGEDNDFNWSPSAEFALYGKTTCENIPGDDLDCPLAYGWTELATFQVNALRNRWREVSGSFVAQDDYTAIGFGASCGHIDASSQRTQYHYLDNLRVTGEFSNNSCVTTFDFSPVGDGDCIDGYRLEVDPPSGAQLQWYRDGVAVAGATNRVIRVPPSNPGNYRARAILLDGRCVLSADTLINSLSDSFLVAPVVTDVVCNGLANGSITLGPQSAFGPYDVSWSTGASGLTVGPLPPGDYTVTIVDANGCTGDTSATIIEPTPIGAVINFVNQPTPTEGGSAGVSGVNGDFPYTYDWSNGASGPIQTDLSPGTYVITVTDLRGCATETMLEILELLSATSVVGNESCLLDCDGSIGISARGGNGPYTYRWSIAGEAGPDLSGLCPGAYELTLTDANGGVFLETFTVEPGSQLTVDVSKVGVRCGSDDEATLVANPNTGNAPFQFAWSTGVTSSEISTAIPGIYAVTVTDGSGCQRSADTELAARLPITITGTVSNPVCQGQLGAINLNTSGGQGDIEFLWSNGATSATVTDLTAGMYGVTATDAVGCTRAESFAVMVPDSFLVETSVIPNACGGGLVGSIRLRPPATGYDVRWSTNDVGAELTDLSGGAYSATVTSPAGCEQVYQFALADLADPISVTIVPSPPTCGERNGAVTLLPEGGTGDYSYIWGGGQSSDRLTGLGGGDYLFTVTDEAGCSLNGIFSLLEATGISVRPSVTQPSCPEAEDGRIDLMVSTGSNPLSIAWADGSVGSSLTGIGAGTYSPTVTDAEGCAFDTTFTIMAPLPFAVDSLLMGNDCAGDADGSISLTPPSDGELYSIEWEDGSTEFTLIELQAGSYAATVTNGVGCSQSYSFVLRDTIPTLNAERVLRQPRCFGEFGELRLTASGGEGPYVFNGVTSPSSFRFSLSDGSYEWPLTDANGCALGVSFEVAEPDSLGAAIVSRMDSEPNEATGSVKASAIGGTDPLTFAWSNGMPGPTISNLPSGVYFVTVTDTNGCTATASATVEELSVVRATAAQSDNSCFGDCQGSITLQPAGGRPPYAIDWSDGQSTATATGLCAGEYAVTIMDADGVLAEAQSFIISEPNELSVSVAAVPISCPGEMDGTLSAVAAGGVAPYTFVWNGEEGVDSLLGLGPGRYSLLALDANACRAVEEVEVTGPALRSLRATAARLDCDSEAYTIRVSGSGRDSVDWFLNDVATELGPDGTISELPAGPYTVAYREGVGCEVVVADFDLVDGPGYELIVDESPRRVEFGDEVRFELRSIPPEQVLRFGSVEWAAADAVTCFSSPAENCVTVELQPRASQIVSLSYRDTIGCVTEFRVPIFVAEPRLLYAPTAFSPNQDGVNDEFTLFSTDFVTAIERATIYDRWGGRVYSARDLPPGDTPIWDGQVTGRPAAIGVYVYQIELLLASGEERTVVGEVTLLR